MTKKKRCISIYLIILILLSLSSTYGQENPNLYFQNDLSLKDYASLPFVFQDGNDIVPRNLIDIGDVVSFSNILDTSYFDKKYPAVEIKSIYRIIDIVELASKNAYVLAQKKDKIVKVFSKEEFDDYYNRFNNSNITISFLPGGYNRFDNIFRNTGIKDSLNTESDWTIRFFEGDIENFQIDLYNTESIKKTLTYRGYYTPIGNVISGKYNVDLKNLEKTHSEFCDIVDINYTASNKLDRRKIRLAQELSHYYGPDYIPYNNFLSCDDSFQYISSKIYSFKRISEFYKFLHKNEISSVGQIKYSSSKKYRIIKHLKISDNKQIIRESFYLIDSSESSYNSKEIISLVEDIIDSYKIHFEFIDNKISLKIIS